MEKSTGLFHWIPRTICILAILFVSMFALDSFAPGLTVWQQIGGFLIHLIPSYILIGLLIIAWKWELVGGIIYTIAGLAFCIFLFLVNHSRNHTAALQSFVIALLIAFPFVIAGILFIISYYRGKKNHSSE